MLGKSVFLLNTTQSLALETAELQYLSYFTENSVSHMKLTQFWRYSSWNTSTYLNNSKTRFYSALQGLMKGEAKGTKLTGSARQLCTFYWKSLRWWHVWPLCTIFHSTVWAHHNSFYKSYCILKKIFSSFFFFFLWKMLQAITSTTLCLSLGSRGKQQRHRRDTFLSSLDSFELSGKNLIMHLQHAVFKALSIKILIT